MFQLLLLTIILGVFAVDDEVEVKVPDETIPAESGRFIKINDENKAYYGMRTSNQKADMHDSRQYHSQKYNKEDQHIDNQRNDKDDTGRVYRIKLHDDDDFRGPAILRSINTKNMQEHDPDIVKQNQIIADVFSPDYQQPIWILDYRYMKTGGRDYTRGPGGQILILPKNVHTDEQKEFRDYDSLLEHLRLKNMANKVKP